MQIFAVIGSPRKHGNTDLLIDQIFEGARANGHDCQKLYLYSQKILPCMDCRQCKQGNNICPIKDDMRQITVEIVNADLIIFGTPIYWYGPTGPMKIFVDRLRPFIVTRKLEGKKGVLVIPSEEGPSICEPTIKMFEMSFQYLGMISAGNFLATAYEKGEIAQKPGRN